MSEPLRPADVLRSSDPPAAFTLLAPELQRRAVAAAEAMDTTAQAHLAGRLGQMGIDDFIRLAETLPAGGATYRVQRGDTLSRIARAHGTTLDRLLAVNPDIQDPDRIFPDQVVQLPPSTH